MPVNPGASKRLLFLRVDKTKSTKTTQRAHPPRKPRYQADQPCSARKDAARSLPQRETKQGRANRLLRARGGDHAFAVRASFPSKDIREPPPAKTGHRKTNPSKADGKISTVGSHRAQSLRYRAGRRRIETSSQQGCDGNPGSQREGKLKKKNTHLLLL